VEANSTGGQDSRRAVAPSDDDDNETKVSYCSLVFGVLRGVWMRLADDVSKLLVDSIIRTEVKQI
jgi:hypothetical protein